VFMHKQNPIYKFGLFTYRPCRFLRLWSPS